MLNVQILINNISVNPKKSKQEREICMEIKMLIPKLRDFLRKNVPKS